jgi:hypothetical protein
MCRGNIYPPSSGSKSKPNNKPTEAGGMIILKLEAICSSETPSYLRIIRRYSLEDRMKCTTSWDITPCSPLKVNRRFAGIYRLHIPVRKINRADTSVKAGSKQSLTLQILKTLSRYVRKIIMANIEMKQDLLALNMELRERMNKIIKFVRLKTEWMDYFRSILMGVFIIIIFGKSALSEP